MSEITQEIVRKLFRYEPTTGAFFWRIDRSGNSASGIEVTRVNAKGYLKVQVRNKQYPVHRLIWLYVYGKFPSGVIDHIDHDKKNNSLSNLRDVSQHDNTKNRSRSKANTSRFTGVFWYGKRNRWVSQIRVKNKNIHLGSFIDFEEAVVARKKANKLYRFHEGHGVK